MSKVKLIIQEGYGSNYRPYIGGTDEVIDLKIEVPDTHDIKGIVRTDFDKEKDGSVRTNDELTPVIRHDRVNDLVGKLMTLADASFTDKEQRKAFKDILMQIPWTWYTGQTESLTEPWRGDKFPNYARAFDATR